MISIQLDYQLMQQLEELARREGKAVDDLVRRVVVDYLDFRRGDDDSDDDWAAASVAMAPEVMEQERWNNTNNGP